jgi:hypothetical protein
VGEGRVRGLSGAGAESYFNAYGVRGKALLERRAFPRENIFLGQGLQLHFTTVYRRLGWLEEPVRREEKASGEVSAMWT